MVGFVIVIILIVSWKSCAGSQTPKNKMKTKYLRNKTSKPKYYTYEDCEHLIIQGKQLQV